MNCMLCKAMLYSNIENERGTCENCARKTGAVVMAPARRRPMPCAKCNHTKLVRAIPRELGTAGEVESNGPMFATYVVARHRYGPDPIHPRSGFGILEMYICRKCGFVEWYCQRPEEIPIGPEYLTEEIDADGDAPYR